MPRLQYYNYFANTTKYDLELSVQLWHQYNNDSHNPSRRSDPNNLNYDLNIDDIDFSIYSLYDRLLISVDEQIYLYLSQAEAARITPIMMIIYHGSKKSFPKFHFHQQFVINDDIME